MPEHVLSWRIPTSGDPRVLRLTLAHIGLASIVAALLLVFAGPRDWLLPGLLGLIPLAIFMAFLRWRRYQQSMAGDDNVWLDAAGLHWLDHAGREQLFRRDQITGFHIGDSQETLRATAALTVYLSDGFESQPIELHPPATSIAVRDLLSGQWNLVECEPTRDNYYDMKTDVFSECHAEFQEWHWEGTREELLHFFGLIEAAAIELPPPPPGVKPAKRIVLTSRREPARLSIAHSQIVHLDDDQIAAPASILRHIAHAAAGALSRGSGEADHKFDVELGPRDRWTFYLHVRQ
jgi:hypothetical protein